MKLNPHNILIALDPPGEASRRRWRCDCCKIEGLMDEVQAIECAFVYPPCKHCGLSGECAQDCPGMMALLGSLAANPKVYIAGMPPRDLTKCIPCMGYGCHPTKDQSLWPPGAKPDEIGYVFVKCRDCGGTGKKADAAEA